MYNIEIKYFKKVEHEKIKANFSIVLNDNIEISGLKLIYSPKNDRFYVVFPSFTYKDKYYPYVKFSDSLSLKVLSEVLELYKNS